QAVHRLLTGPETSFVVVTSFDAAKLAEARHLRSQLKRLGYNMQGVVINRAFPLGVPDELSSAPENFDAGAYEKVLAFYKKFKEFYAIRYNLYEEFSRELDPAVRLVRVPEYQRDVYGLGDLEALAGVIGGGGAIG